MKMRKLSFEVVGLGLVIVLNFVFLFEMNLLDCAQWLSALKRMVIFAGDLFPPRWDILPTVGPALWETIKISFCGTSLGFVLSVPLAFGATTVLFHRKIAYVIRFLLGGIRTIPSILWGVLFVVAFGFGASAGTLGIAFYTVGYLAKLYYEAFEAVDHEVVEAVRATGCNRLQLFRFAILPESANTIISQIFFMFEYNIRSSTIMGFVGAGGIGYYLLGYLQMLQYQHLLTALLATLLVVMMIDYLSLKLRSWVVVAVPKS